jgi:hypothetical protein
VQGNVGIESSISPEKENSGLSTKDVIKILEEEDYVVFAIESI